LESLEKTEESMTAPRFEDVPDSLDIFKHGKGSKDSDAEGDSRMTPLALSAARLLAEHGIDVQARGDAIRYRPTPQ
jgi:hypothetical protein